MKYLRNIYVPIVCKSHDYLTGFIDSLNSLAGLLTFDKTILDSTRFTDTLPDDSKRRDKSDEEIKEIMSHFRESMNVKENEKEDSENDFYFEVSCKCGNFYGFRHPSEIPTTNLKCDICERVLIDYTNKHDYEMDYDGDMERMSVEFSDPDEEDDEE